MAELPEADVEVDAMPERGWVWRCTDASIEKGQVSVLSVLETFWALGLYGVLVWYFGHYWWVLITAFAAPIVLLRSEESVISGIEMLGNYARKEKGSSLTKPIILFLFLFFSFACYWLSHGWLTDYQGIHLIWRSILLGIFAFYITCIGFTVHSLNIPTNQTIFIVIILSTVIAGMTATMATGAMAAIGIFIGLICTIIIVNVVNIGTIQKNAFLSKSLKKRDAFVLLTLFIPALGIGIWFRTLFIRIIATLRHLAPGVINIPSNTHQISWSIDFTHPPEALPKASIVHPGFSVSTLLDGLSKSHTTLAIQDKIFSAILIIIWYIPALLWRWSLKATLWLWWPLALCLKKPFQTATMPQIRDAIVTIVAGWWKLLLMPIPVVIPWLLSGYFPTEISGLVDTMPDQINKLFDKLISYAVPHPNNLRYAAICLVCTLSIVICWKANAMKTLFKMIIDDETYIIQHDIENDPKYSELKQKFYHRAKGIARWHTLRIVSFILLGYSYILYLAYAWYPEQAGRVIPEWLTPYL